MANKDIDGGKKHSKKNNMKENRKRGPYSQKCARLKENLIHIQQDRFDKTETKKENQNLK
jgi:hypothetical protein